MAYTEVAKNYMLSQFMDKLTVLHVIDDNNSSVDTVSASFSFKSDVSLVEPGEFGITEAAVSMPLDFSIPPGTTITHVWFSRTGPITSSTPLSSYAMAVYELPAPEHFPNGGTFTITDISWDLNEGGSHVEPTLP